MPRHPTHKFKLPEFDGSEDVEGYLRLFEMGCLGMHMDEGQMKVTLATKLTGTAASWVQGLDSLVQMSY